MVLGARLATTTTWRPSSASGLKASAMPEAISRGAGSPRSTVSLRSFLAPGTGSAVRMTPQRRSMAAKAGNWISAARVRGRSRCRGWGCGRRVLVRRQLGDRRRVDPRHQDLAFGDAPFRQPWLWQRQHRQPQVGELGLSAAELFEDLAGHLRRNRAQEHRRGIGQVCAQAQVALRLRSLGGPGLALLQEAVAQVAGVDDVQHRVAEVDRLVGRRGLAQLLEGVVPHGFGRRIGRRSRELAAEAAPQQA